MKAAWMLPLVLWLGGHGSELIAQQPQGPDPGSRVRIWAPGVSRRVLVGVLLDRSDSGMAMAAEPGAERLTVPWGAIRELEVSRGTRTRAARGALIGAGIGAALATLALVAFCEDPDTACEFDEAVIFYAVFTLPPAGAGALLGSLSRYEKWERFPLGSPSLVLGAGPERTLRMGIGFALP